MGMVPDTQRQARGSPHMTYIVPTPDSSVSFAQWVGDQWNFGAMLNDLLTWYGASFGTGLFGIAMFIGVVLLLIFGVQAIRQESLVLPGAAIAVVGVSTELFEAVPSSMQALFLMIFVVLPVTGVFYDIYRKR
jgi:hypothetical protein